MSTTNPSTSLPKNLNTKIMNVVVSQSGVHRFSRCVQGFSDAELHRASDLEHKIMHLRMDLEEAS